MPIARVALRERGALFAPPSKLAVCFIYTGVPRNPSRVSAYSAKEAAPPLLQQTLDARKYDSGRVPL